MKAAPKKILIIKPSALGDVIQALPVAAGLRKHWPEAEIHWLISEVYEELLKKHPSIDKLIVYPRKRWSHPQFWKEIPGWFSALKAQQYDLVIDLQGLFRTGLMSFATRSKRRLGLRSAREGSIYFYNEMIDDSAISAAERYLECLKYLGIQAQPLDFQLVPTEPLPAELQEKSYIVFHPYSRWRTKLWPWRYYQQVMEMLPTEKFVVVGEGPWFPFHGDHLIDLRGKLSLCQLMTVLKNAKAVVSTDSGPAHLAAALDTYTIVLFGATDWRKTKPLGKNVSVERIPVFCSPCLKRHCYRDSRMECMVNLLPQTIANKLLIMNN